MSDVFVEGLCNNVQIIVYSLVLRRVQILKVVNFSTCECIRLTAHVRMRIKLFKLVSYGAEGRIVL